MDYDWENSTKLITITRNRFYFFLKVKIKFLSLSPSLYPNRSSMGLVMPLIRSAVPMNIIIVIAAATGKEIAIAAKIRIRTPRPILDHLDLLGEKSQQ